MSFFGFLRVALVRRVLIPSAVDLFCRGLLRRWPRPSWPCPPWASSARALSAVVSPVPRPPWASSTVTWPCPPWTSSPHLPRTTSAVRLICCGPRPPQLCPPWASSIVDVYCRGLLRRGRRGPSRSEPRPPRAGSASSLVCCFVRHESRLPWTSSTVDFVRLGIVRCDPVRHGPRPPRASPTVNPDLVNVPRPRPPTHMVARNPESAEHCTALTLARRSRCGEMRRPGRMYFSTCESCALCHGHACLSHLGVLHIGTRQVSMIPWGSKCLLT